MYWRADFRLVELRHSVAEFGWLHLIDTKSLAHLNCQ